MTVAEWRANGDMLALAAVVLEQPAVKQMLAVLEQENPAFRPRTIRDGADAMYEIGFIHGCAATLENLRNLREPLPKKQEDIKESWGVKED